MWDYSDKVKEHFLNPRNVGEMEDADGIGDTGSLKCGDALRLYIKVDNTAGEERISAVKFQTFGCASAIAAASAMTEMIDGMTIEEASKVTNDDIVEYLGGLPAPKIHCSVMGAEALKLAIADYRGESPESLDPNAVIICACFEVTEKKIRDAIFDHNLTTVEQVTQHTKAGGACGQCIPDIERIIGEVLAEKAAATCELTPANERERAIKEVIDNDVASALGAHGGGIQLVAVDGDKVVVRMEGACKMCSAVNATINSVVEKMLRDKVDEDITVEVGG